MPNANARHYREKAAECADFAKRSTSLAQIRNFRRAERGYIALAEKEERLVRDDNAKSMNESVDTPKAS